MITKYFELLFSSQQFQKQSYETNKKNNNNIPKSWKIGEGGDEKHVFFFYLA